ncbi:hypothetical protein [Actinokineospora sp. HUAS TT18]|uniref:hypothetical protein n=1 Tax=Actinokineospora sp. HUAS TT18 TaxID=3447451 RepID=UPI003F51ECA9
MSTKVTTRLAAALSTAGLLLLLGGGLEAGADPGGNGNGNGTPAAAADHGNKGGNKPTQDLTQPQPASNADFSGNGANTHGPYDSTRDGSPALNGNGDGKSVGKPCAGCVGKADNKNPKGQLPGGSDANAGYECDRNRGIGRSNPAHTGCKSTTTVPSTPPTTTTPSTTTPSTTTGTTTQPSTTPAVTTSSATPAAVAQGRSTPSSAELASTGVNALPMVLIGLAALGLGTGAILVTRRRAAR